MKYPKMKVLAPAKVNLYLEVLKRDSNGFHEIETVFQAVELYDEISLSESSGGNVEVACYDSKKNAINSLSGEKNIVYKAALLLRKIGKVKKGIRIEVVKNIPVAAGLGGGSSDAAAVFTGLNSLWKLGIKRAELISIAGKLGKDIPFFLFGHCALGRGYGDIITPLPPMSRKWVLLVRPKIKVKTKHVYDRLNGRIGLTKALNVNKIKALLKKNTGQLLFNRLEDVTLKEYPIIVRIKEFLIDNGARCTLMSGSGPVVFTFVRGRESGNKLKEGIEKAFNCSSWLVRTC